MLHLLPKHAQQHAEPEHTQQHVEQAAHHAAVYVLLVPKPACLTVVASRAPL
jgi:hypothetical protein